MQTPQRLAQIFSWSSAYCPSPTWKRSRENIPKGIGSDWWAGPGNKLPEMEEAEHSSGWKIAAITVQQSEWLSPEKINKDMESVCARTHIRAYACKYMSCMCESQKLKSGVFITYPLLRLLRQGLPLNLKGLSWISLHQGSPFLLSRGLDSRQADCHACLEAPNSLSHTHGDALSKEPSL